MRYQLELFLTAIGFFTRLPVPSWVPWSEERLNHAARYFPLVGWVVGAVGAGSYLIFAALLPISLAVILSTAITVRLTGAFHEDGLADTCDGLGAAWNKEQALLIMKDSRIGSYGTVGLCLMLLAKMVALIEIGIRYPLGVPMALLAAHPLSRLAATTLIHSLSYVREDRDAKSKPLAHRLNTSELLIAVIFGLLPLLLFPLSLSLIILICCVTTTFLGARYLVRRLGGYTGDCLGAIQQFSELSCYLGLLILWKFT